MVGPSVIWNVQRKSMMKTRVGMLCSSALNTAMSTRNKIKAY